MNRRILSTLWLHAPGVLVAFSLAIGSIASVAEAQGQPTEIVYGQTDFTSSGADSTASTLHSPRGVAVDSSGNVYVADTFNNRVLEFPSTCPSAGCSASRVYGRPDFTTPGGAAFAFEPTASTLNSPVGVAVDSSANVYVADGNNRVLEFPATCPVAGCSATRVFGQASFTATNSGWSATTLDGIRGVAVDSKGNVYVADSARVLEFPSTCAATGCAATRVFGASNFTSPGGGGTTAATLRPETAVGLDSSDNVYVADTENRRVLEFPNTCAPAGCSATRVFGQPDFTTGIQGLMFTPTAANLEAPVGVAVDSSGNVYILDTGDSRVLEFSSSCPSAGCSATRVYGQTSFTGREAGLTATGVYVPRGVAVDSRGWVYVADGNNRVLGGLPVGFDPSAPAAPTSHDQSPATATPAPTASAPEVTLPSPPDIDAPPNGPEPTAVPDILTDSLRADILAAVDRGNAAWSAAQQSLDPADLQSGLTGQELSADTSQLVQFRSVGEKKKPLNIAFTVLDVSLDSPTEASVHTHETWSDDVYNANTGTLIRHDPSTSYSETYTVDLIDGEWTVSQIQLQ